MELLGGTTRLRAGLERAERGLPGRSFAPSPEARQAERRLHLSAGWSRPEGALPAEVEVYAARHRSRFRDPAPSGGLPYDETSRVGQVGARGRLSHPTPPGPLGELAVGWALEHQGVETDALEGGSPVRRTDMGAFVTAGLPLAGGLLDARGVGRLDRDGLTGAAVGSHEVELRATPGPLSLRVAHRSSYSPPALSDRFFRAGVGVEPNPDLRAVRVPSELEAGLSAGATLAGWSLDASVDVYRADVRGMIVWSPDHRFVWSPRNVDVLRRGAELRLDGTRRMGSGRLRLSSSWSLARVTYTRADLRGVQLRYRPRHAARLAGSWEAPDHGLSVQARYVGSRLPVPSDVNRLPGFWTVDLTAGTTVRVGGWRVEPRIRVDRLRDVRNSMIFAFPEPGRTVGLELTVRPPPGRR